MSDHWGRRPILLLGIFSDTVAFFFLGISPNYYWAVASRALSGFFNCTLPSLLGLSLHEALD